MTYDPLVGWIALGLALVLLVGGAAMALRTAARGLDRVGEPPRRDDRR
ncbi:MAG: hypothetical protein K2X11_02250 [Acetobacteraceae bacterium]|nr:hypothetical protein [Acetobacteraceae bacterium]